MRATRMGSPPASASARWKPSRAAGMSPASSQTGQRVDGLRHQGLIAQSGGGGETLLVEGARPRVLGPQVMDDAEPPEGLGPDGAVAGAAQVDRLLIAVHGLGVASAPVVLARLLEGGRGVPRLGGIGAGDGHGCSG